MQYLKVDVIMYLSDFTPLTDKSIRSMILVQNSLSTNILVFCIP
jgi:hypothetical protein